MKKLLIICAAIVFVFACKKEDPMANPFENGTVENPPIDTVNLYSIRGLHKNIFAVKCAIPTCHDGSFEPDYRTVESMYNSLVYQPVIKNNAQYSYTYRVVPGSIAESWLYERLITADPNLGRMPLYSPALNNQELLQISGWILDGARNSNGEKAVFPNLPPVVKYYFATDANNQRLDTVRTNGWSSPFVVPTGSNFTLYFWVEDDSTNVQNLLVNQIKIAASADDFSNATVHQAHYISSNLWGVNLQSSQFAAGLQMYFRYYVEDTDGGSTEKPRNDLPFYYKENASFIIQ